jgi:hypothetical protein
VEENQDEGEVGGDRFAAEFIHHDNCGFARWGRTPAPLGETVMNPKTIIRDPVQDREEYKRSKIQL